MSRTKDAFSRYSTKIHRAVFTASKGRVLGKVFGMPVVEVTMTGRKSGKTRHAMLGAPICEPDRVVVVASYDGAPHNPAWYLNLCSNPSVTVTRNGQSQAMTARTASPEEKAVLWPTIVSAAKAYGKAQDRTARDIPVVILTPVDVAP